ncbi:glycosyltransferase [Mycobacterium sp. NPDC048908]|uniref:glycosyltransferase n=1 Tax=Mycobacterium sp. NPDC048908 TaxID=3364292 RepID=UPI0037129A2D
MRITQVTSALFDPRGGAEHYCMALAIRQAELGHQVTVASALISDGVRNRLKDVGVEVKEVGAWAPYSANQQAPNLAAKVAFHGLDLVGAVRTLDALVGPEIRQEDAVHVHRFQGLGLGALRLREPAVVHTVHDHALVDTRASAVRRGELVTRLPVAQRIRTRVVNHALRDVGAVVFPTRRILDRHRAHGLRLRADQVHVIPHGWQLPAPRPRHADDDRCTFLFLGRLTTEKGLPLLLDAWGDGVDGARLVIGGTGAGEHRCQELHRRGIVDFRGWLAGAAKADVFAEADVLVMPSTLAENFPLVDAEALLAGIPVLSSEISAPEFLQDGVNSVIVPAEVGALRGAMVKLARDKGFRVQLMKGATSSAGDLDFDRHVERLLTLYTAVRDGVREAL